MDKSAAVMTCVLLLVSGCASTPAISWVNARHDTTAGTAVAHDAPAAVAAQPGACTQGALPQRDVQLDMINNIVAQGALYAALAHLDALDKDAQQTPPARYLRADILRRTGRTDEARKIYDELLKTCLAGAGHHGLGLIAAQAGDLGLALRHLETARWLLPTDPKVRNDYGYALLLDKQREAARREFITAMELGDNEARAAMNYLTLLFVEGKSAEAMQFAGQTHLSREDVQAVQQRALQLNASDTRDKATRSERTAEDRRDMRNAEVKP